MMYDKFHGQPRLLGSNFKRIGIALMSFSLMSAYVIKTMNFEVILSNNEFFKLVVYSGFLFGLLLIALSRDKVEDELTMTIRVKTMQEMFVFGILFVIINPFILLIFQLPKNEASGQQIVTIMLIGYLIIYYYRKLFR